MLCCRRYAEALADDMPKVLECELSAKVTSVEVEQVLTEYAAKFCERAEMSELEDYESVSMAKNRLAALLHDRRYQTSLDLAMVSAKCFPKISKECNVFSSY